MPAVVAGLDVAAEGSGAACSNSLHDAPLRTRERTPVLRTIGVTVLADDVRQLDLRSLHLGAPDQKCSGALVGSGGSGLGSRSSGLRVAQILETARRR
jgi:hypothetical protein